MCLLLKKKNYYMKVRFKVQNWIVVCFCIRIHFFLPCVCVYLFLINKFKKKKSYIWRWGSRFKIVFGRRVGVKNPRHWRLGIRLDTDYHASAFACLFLFFLKCVLWLWCYFWCVPCTVYETHKPLFSSKISLKMSLTTLFTHLKIILL